MHYIRLLRPPVVEVRRTHIMLKLVVTITTDLGDSFLSPSDPVQIAVIGAYTEHKDGKDQLTPYTLTQTHPFPKWQAGMRVLKIDVPLPRQAGIKTIQIRPASPHLTALSISDICRGKDGLIMAAYADIYASVEGAEPACFRSLRLPAPGQALQVEEDVGESIARHIWDAGVTMVSLIADLVLDSKAQGPETTPPILQSILQARNIMELGCGVGVLSIGMARILSMAEEAKATRQILMTDLPEAEEKARANIARQPEPTDSEASVQLDFEALDWEEAKNGVFGDKVRSRAWDLVVLSDCTYNADMLAPLVKTLDAIRCHSARQETGDVEGAAETEVLLATKPRHESEKILFQLMAADGWVIKQKTVLPLPVLDEDAQAVEVYLFGAER